MLHVKQQRVDKNDSDQRKSDIVQKRGLVKVQQESRNNRSYVSNVANDSNSNSQVALGYCTTATESCHLQHSNTYAVVSKEK